MLHGLAEGLAVRRVESLTGWVNKTTQRTQEYVQEIEKSIESMRNAMREWYPATRE